jgi:hypothetical protein
MFLAFAVTIGLLSLLVAFTGRQTPVGFWGIFILCLLFSPFIMSLILLIALPRRMA